MLLNCTLIDKFAFYISTY